MLRVFGDPMMAHERPSLSSSLGTGAAVKYAKMGVMCGGGGGEDGG